MAKKLMIPYVPPVWDRNVVYLPDTNVVPLDMLLETPTKTMMPYCKAAVATVMIIDKMMGVVHG